MPEPILPKTYIYIIFPIKKIYRLYYIGQTTDFEKRKNEHYKNLNNLENTTKCYQIMRDIYKYDKKSDKIEINKYWNISCIFEGCNICTQNHLNTIEGIYMYYFYSILNDKAPSNFNINYITNQPFYNKIGFKEILTFIRKYQYNINPWELINKNNIEYNSYIHIYSKICKNQFILNFTTNMPFHKCQLISNQYKITTNKNHNNIRKKCYKCHVCNIKSYKFKNKWYKKHTKICMKK